MQTHPEGKASTTGFWICKRHHSPGPISWFSDATVASTVATDLLKCPQKPGTKAPRITFEAGAPLGVQQHEPHQDEPGLLQGDLRAMKDGRGKEPKNIKKCGFFLDKLEITEIRIKKSTQCMICEGDKNREYLRSIEKNSELCHMKFGDCGFYWSGQTWVRQASLLFSETFGECDTEIEKNTCWLRACPCFALPRCYFHCWTLYSAMTCRCLVCI